MDPRTQKPSFPLSRLVSGWYPVVWISLAVLLVYAKTTGFGFLAFDELYLVAENKAFLSDPASIARVFFQSVGGKFDHFYRPVLMLSFIADAQLLGFYPFWYHVTNILLHLSGTLLLFALLRRLKCGDLRSFACALVFAVHPVLVQAVAWVPGRNDSLLGIGVFGSAVMLIDYAERRRMSSYILHLAGLFFALLSKETAVSVFPVFAAYLFLVDREMPRPARVKVIGGWAVVAAAYVLLYTHAIAYDPAFYQKVFSCAPMLPAAFLNYLGKMLFPFHLSGFPYIGDISFIAGIPAAAVIVLAVILARNKRWELVWFGAIWTVCFFLPSLVLGWQGIQFEHRAYVPLAGLFIIAGGLRGGLIDLPVSRSRVIPAAVAALLAVFIVISVRYSDVFADSETFWKNAVRTSPRSYVAHKNLGVVYGQAGRFDLALASFRKALALNGQDTSTRNFAVDCLVVLGKMDEAMRESRTILRIDPGNADAKRKLLWLSEKNNGGDYLPGTIESAR